MIDNIIVEVKPNEDRAGYAASVTSVEPVQDFVGAIGMDGKNADEATENLMKLVRSFGYQGDFTVYTTSITRYFVTPEPEEEYVEIRSDSNYFKTYNVTYLKGRTPEYKCDCADFVHRKHDVGGWCKHIRTAYYSFDLGRS